MIFERGIANPSLGIHHWAIVGSAALALALVLQMKISAKGNPFWILEGPVRRPIRGFGLGTFPLAFILGFALSAGFLPLRLANGRPPFALLGLP